jgi:preprotein translocase subunit SecA
LHIFDAVAKEFTKIIPFDDNSQIELKKTLGATVEEHPQTAAESITQRLIEIAHQTYDTRQDVVGTANMRQVEQFVILTTIDEKWMDHLDEMDNLRDGIWLRGDKNTVLSEYKREGFAMFEKLIGNIESANLGSNGGESWSLKSFGKLAIRASTAATWWRSPVLTIWATRQLTNYG